MFCFHILLLRRWRFLSSLIFKLRLMLLLKNPNIIFCFYCSSSDFLLTFPLLTIQLPRHLCPFSCASPLFSTLNSHLICSFLSITITFVFFACRLSLFSTHFWWSSLIFSLRSSLLSAISTVSSANLVLLTISFLKFHKFDCV